MSVPNPDQGALAPTTRLPADQQDTYVAIWAKTVDTPNAFQ
jgi:hypothetical protein